MASVRKRTWTHKGEEKTAWVLDYVDNKGRRRQKTFERKKEAEAARISIGAEVSRGLHVADRETSTVAVACSGWLTLTERRHKAGEIGYNTLRHYRGIVENMILPKFGAVKLTRLSAASLQDWFEELAYRDEKPVSAASISYVRIVMTEVLSWAVGRQLLTFNPMKVGTIKTVSYRAPKTEFLDRVTIRHILNSSDGPLRIALHVMAFTGLRGGELRALCWDDIDFVAGEVKVRRAADQQNKIKAPKTRAGIRDVPLAPRLSVMLKEWKLRTSYIPLPPREDVQRMWVGRVDRAAIERFGPACFQRTNGNLVSILTSVECGDSMLDAVKLAGLSWPTLKDWRKADPKVDALVCDALEMARRHNNRDNLCFINEQGKILYQNRLQTVDLNALLKSQGLDQRNDSGRLDFHLHLLRHVAASLFIEQGLGPKRIQNIMGHASIKTTFDTYGHLFEDREALKRAVAEIEAALLG